MTPQTQINNSYLGNNRLRRADVNIEYTYEQIAEYNKCANDPVYFIKKYVHIVNLDRGRILFDLYDCQEKLVNHYHDNRFSLLMAARQSGKTDTTWAYILWYILFNDNKRCAIIAHKESRAKDTLARLKKAYELLPNWIQQGVLSWNKKSIELENGSALLAAPTTESGITGDTISLLYLDEFALVSNAISEGFWASSWPTISSGHETKVIISSTPRGYNLFWKFWNDSITDKGIFKHFLINWFDIPWRTEAWLQEQKKVLGEVKFNSEVLCQFEGSTNTLIINDTLKRLIYTEPIQIVEEHLKIFEEPIENNEYVTVVDVSRGLGNDYSTITTINVTEIPYRVAAVYRNDLITPYELPEEIYNILVKYNNSYLLIENNDAGAEVADIILHEYEYHNMFYSEHKNKTAEVAKYYGKIAGIRTTTKVKILGCTILKSLLDNSQMILNDSEIIKELSTFIKHKTSYAADTGYNDDLVMGLVLFSWLTQQTIFKNLTNVDTRKTLFNRLKIENESSTNIIFAFDNGSDAPVIIDDTAVKMELDSTKMKSVDKLLFDDDAREMHKYLIERYNLNGTNGK